VPRATGQTGVRMVRRVYAIGSGVGRIGRSVGSCHTWVVSKVRGSSHFAGDELMCTDMERRSVPLQVGVRELRDELRRWLQLVKDGSEVVVTERGRAVAKLVSIDSGEVMEELIAEGIVIPARKPRTTDSSHVRVTAQGSIADLVIEQRG
jgi:prevent-host-death family protein